MDVDSLYSQYSQQSVCFSTYADHYWDHHEDHYEPHSDSAALERQG